MDRARRYGLANQSSSLDIGLGCRTDGRHISGVPLENTLGYAVGDRPKYGLDTSFPSTSI